MIQVRPLSFVRQLPRLYGLVYTVESINGERTVPVYGKKIYVTHDQLFTVEYIPRTHRWHLYTTATAEIHHKDITASYSESGLQYTSFPRRCDAVDALEVFAQSISQYQEAETS